MRPVLSAFPALAVVLGGCGPTEVFYGDTPGVARVVAGVLDTRTPIRPDSGPATETPLAIPGGVALTPEGTFYFTDRHLRMVGEVTPDGALRWVVGRGPGCAVPGPGAGGDPLEACLGDPMALARAADGAILIADEVGNRVYRYDPGTETLAVVMGTGAAATAPDGAVAASSPVYGPWGMVVTDEGALYVAERDGNRVLRVGVDGILRVVAGTGERGDAGDDGPATAALLSFPEGVALIGDTLYVSDALNHRIRRVVNDSIFAYSGIGVPGLRGDGMSVTQALYRRPGAMATVGTLLYVLDRGNNRVRIIRTDADSITTWAGDGGTGPGQDLTEITRTPIGGPQGVAVLERTVLIADSGGAVIRRVIR